MSVPAEQMNCRIGIDIGGTFTDFAVSHPDGIFLWKESSTPDEPEDAIREGLKNIAAHFGRSANELLSETEWLVHGSTIAINTLIQRNGPRIGLVCTRGFRDVLYLRDGFKPERYNPRLPHPEHFVERYLRLGVDERITSDGSVVQSLDEESVREVATKFRDEGVESIAVALMWAHVNPLHEQRVAEILQEELGDVPVLLSSSILAETGEWVRTSATAISAYVYPRSRGYLTSLSSGLAGDGLRSPLQIMQLNGGCSSVEHTLRYPVNTIGSGPAAAPSGGSRAARRIAAEDLIVVDMGGTSFDVCLVQRGQLPLSRELMVEEQPLGAAGVEIHSIGAGGGSIAWIDSGGALRVGPQSAGARPGPAAYGAGGSEPTVTDANVVLGYLSPDGLLSGRRGLDAEAAAQAIRERVADPLGLDVTVAAAGMVRVVNESMVNAIGVVSVQRGIDPKPFVLVAGGGAGALHAGRLAAALGISRVLIPAEAGTISAYGMTTADVRHDHIAPLYMTSAEPRPDALRSLYEQLERDARSALQDEGFRGDQITLTRFVDARYEGQVHELIAPVPTGEVNQDLIDEIAKAFHRLHADRYGWMREDYPIELLHWRVAARAVLDASADPEFQVGGSGVVCRAPRTRPAYFDEYGEFRETPAFREEEIPSGATVAGPALIDCPATTIVVYPGQQLVGDGRGNFVIDIASA